MFILLLPLYTSGPGQGRLSGFSLLYQFSLYLQIPDFHFETFHGFRQIPAHGRQKIPPCFLRDRRKTKICPAVKKIIDRYITNVQYRMKIIFIVSRKPGAHAVLFPMFGDEEKNRRNARQLGENFARTKRQSFVQPFSQGRTKLISIYPGDMASGKGAALHFTLSTIFTGLCTNR